jgi:adenylyl-sulfate kinase
MRTSEKPDRPSDDPRRRGAARDLALVKTASRPGRRAAGDAASRNLTRAASRVSREERQERFGHRGAVLWFTGLSGSGKSTIAMALERELFRQGRQVVVLDGDNIRLGLNADLGFSDADRKENLRRVAQVARLFASAGHIAIVAFISPFQADRERARAILAEEIDLPFSEIYVSTPISVCEARDPKRLYARARAGEIPSFTGVSSPFEIPDRPDVAIDTTTIGVEDAVGLLIAHLEPRIALAHVGLDRLELDQTA